jgi:hypothetical protein
MMNDTASPPARTGRVKWGRIISLAGALGLCVSFFLPHWGDMGVSSPLEWMGQVTDGLKRVRFSDLLALPIVLPFLTAAMLVPLLAFRMVRRTDTLKGVGIFLAWGQSVVCLVLLSAGLVVTGYILIYAWHVGYTILIEWYAQPTVGLAGLVLAFLALVLARLPRKAAASLFALWLYHLTFFLSWIIAQYSAYDGSVLSGLCVSFFACGALVIGSAIDWFQCRPRAA